MAYETCCTELAISNYIKVDKDGWWYLSQEEVEDKDREEILFCPFCGANLFMLEKVKKEE